MSYTPNFAISFINIDTGNSMVDAGTSDLKTAKGAARNWSNNVGHVIDSWLCTESITSRKLGYKGWTGVYEFNEIRIIVRPIDNKNDAINMNVKLSNPDDFINREQRNGATILTMDELF